VQRYLFVLALCVGTLASTARAQSYESEYAMEGRDHRGLFMRASAGLGYTGIFASPNGFDVAIDGVSSLWNFAIGGSVTERFALHFVYFGGSATLR
jgi:hypothetical protein